MHVNRHGYRTAALLATFAFVSGSAQGMPLSTEQKLATYRAEIRRTPYGIPHVKADDWEGLGFGAGIASAGDTICEFFDRVLAASGKRAFYLGRGDGDANVQSDLFYARHRARVREWLDGDASSPETPSPEARALARGYVAGVNHYVRTVGRDGISDPRCKGAPWIHEIDELDYWAFASTALGFANQAGVVAALPPGGTGACPNDPAPPAADAVLPSAGETGSNALGLGRDATRNGRGALLGNPHYPWSGPNRFYRMHLTIPGTLNVVGAGLLNTPFVGIGHTDRIAWTHTVSTARRFGYFELNLDPSDPTSYWYDGAWRKMTAVCVSVPVRESDGTVTTASRVFYDTRFGPMVRTSSMPWTATKGFAVREAFAGLRGIDQYLAVYRARDVYELADALNRHGGMAFNTTAVDADGNAFYGDVGGIPHVTEAQAAACTVSPTGLAFWAQRIPVLDGSRPECDWGSDAGAVPGLAGLATAPHLFRSDYVTNSNDSYWLANPAQPLEGYSRVFGDERTARSLRTRMGLRLVDERVLGTDGLGAPRFDLETLQRVIYGNRQLGAELARDTLVGRCRAQTSVVVGGETVDLSAACDVLAVWDLRDNLDSRGAHVWRQFVLNGGLVWSIPFDVNDPVNTPRDLSTTDPRVLVALGQAVRTMSQAGIALDARLGDVQGVTRRGERIPIHGGRGEAGVFNVIGAVGFQPGAGWTDVSTGSSWIMTVYFTDDGPRSQGVLTYSESTDPTSVHSSDQTKLYSSYGWDDLYFTEAAVAAAAVRTDLVTEGADDCKKGGWAKFEVPTFSGQDECVSYFSSLRGGIGRR
jgi:acyl-homoserine-lactone acylase